MGISRSRIFRYAGGTVIEQITVLSAEKIRIRFVDGYTKEQRYKTILH